MPLVNRCAVIVKPKRPFLDWLNGLSEDRDVSLESVRSEPHVFLLSEYIYDDEQPDVLNHFYDLVFEIVLHAWITDEKLWPADRSFEMFQNWFDTEFGSMVIDLVDQPLTYDDSEKIDA